MKNQEIIMFYLYHNMIHMDKKMRKEIASEIIDSIGEESKDKLLEIFRMVESNF